MNNRRVEIGQANIRFTGGNWQSQRAERISRMAFWQVQRLISSAPASGVKRIVESLNSGTLRVSSRRSDADIASAMAAEIRRALTEN